MVDVLALLGYGGLLGLLCPGSLRVWLAGWLAVVTLTIGPAAIPLAGAMFVPIGVLHVIRSAVDGRVTDRA